MTLRCLVLTVTASTANPVIGDLELTRGQPQIATGARAIAQGIETRLREFLAEWFLDRRRGLPWLQEVVGQRADTKDVERLLRRAISLCPGVVGIDALSVALEGRAAVVRELVVQTTDGPIQWRDFTPVLGGLE
jgi:hypothetical protein